MDEFSVQQKSKKLGFHYYEDTAHFDEQSLDYWLPKLRSAGTSWLVIHAPENSEIPENFIRRIRDARIEPIVVLWYSISEYPDKESFRQRIAYYRSVGVRLVQFFNRPNMAYSWSADEWIQPGLVTRFTRRFAEYAIICVNEGLIPIYPVLKPGGDYWDLAFLQGSIRLLKQECGDQLLSNMIFSASGRLFEHPLNWNEGGVSLCPHPKPYSSGGVDHRGFYLFEWYEEILRKECGKAMPMMISDAGLWNRHARILDSVSKESRQQYVNILNLMQDVTRKGPGAIPDYVLTCCIYKLPSTEALSTGKKSSRNKTNNYIFASTAQSPKDCEDEVHSLWKKLLGGIYQYGVNKPVLFVKQFGTNLANVFTYAGRIALNGDKLNEYFLIPEVSSLFTEEQLNVLKQYVKLKQCKSGNDINAALAAKNVILLNDAALYPEYMLQQLRDRGCNIRTISFTKKGA